MTGKSSSTSKSTKSHSKSSTKSQDRQSNKKESGINNISCQNTSSVPQQIDLTEASTTSHSTTTIPIHIPPIQHTKDLVKKITDVRQTLEECRQRRAVLDRLLAENKHLLDLTSPVPEASIRKHIYAQGHLMLLRREEKIQHQDLSILLCFIDRANNYPIKCRQCKETFGQDLRIGICCLPDKGNIQIIWTCLGDIIDFLRENPDRVQYELNNEDVQVVTDLISDKIETHSNTPDNKNPMKERNAFPTPEKARGRSSAHHPETDFERCGSFHDFADSLDFQSSPYDHPHLQKPSADMNDISSPHLSPVTREMEDEYPPFDEIKQDISDHDTPCPMPEFDLTELVSETSKNNLTMSYDSLAGCSHKSETAGLCNLCNQIISPPRARPKGLQKPVLAGVGSGHGRKVSGWCSSLMDVNSMDNDVENVADDGDEDFKRPRIRKDRKQNDLLERRQTRSTSSISK